MVDKPGYDIDDAVCIHESDKAILITAPVFGDDRNGKPVEVWIPQSQITEDSEVWKVGDTGTLIVTEYLAEQRGWI